MSSSDMQMIADPVINLFDPSTPHNAILVVEEHKFYVQTERLSENSDFFKKMFEPEVDEMNETIETEQEEKKPKKKSIKLFRRLFKTSVKPKIDEVQEEKEPEIKEYEIKDVSAAEFDEFLKLFYPGDIEVNIDNFSTLASLSVRFGLLDVLNLSKTFVLCHFNEMNVVDMVEFAIKYDMEDLKNLCSGVLTADNPVESSYPWAADYNGCSCNICIMNGLKLAHGFPFIKESFCSKNKKSILNASEKAKAFILAEIVKAYF